VPRVEIGSREHEGSIPSFVTGYYLGIAEFIAFSSSSAGT
jgi:hypothetical protein